MFRSAAKTFVGCLLCLPLLISAVRYEVRKAMPQPEEVRSAVRTDRRAEAPPPRPAAASTMAQPANEHSVEDVTRDISLIPPIKRAPAIKLKLAPDPLTFEVTDYDLQGIDLARKQIARGLEKRTKRRHEMDQSFQGLRDLIRHSSDPRFKRFLPVVNRLERAMQNRERRPGVDYVEGFITDFAPLAVFVQRETGIPASVVLAQIIVESGWGASNITILKNNVLGIGNCSGEEAFIAEVRFDRIDREINVRCNADTRAYYFDSVADGVLYYAYLLLENESNQQHYGALRRYVRDNRALAERNPRAYRNRVITLIARSYHDDPDWYESYLRRMVDVVEDTQILPEVEWSMTVVADAKPLP